MTDALDTVRALLAGTPGAGRGLRPACTACAFGGEAFGPAMIAELFGRHPRPLSPTPHVVRTAAGLAMFDTDAEGCEQAVVADLYDGHIGRLWRVGATAEANLLDPFAEPALNVAFDPFLNQQRDPVALLASGHPDLEASALRALETLGRDLAEAHSGDSARALVVRAFGSERRAAALLAVHVNIGEPVRARALTLVAAAFRYDAEGRLLHRQVVRDAAPPPPLLLRLVEPGA